MEGKTGSDAAAAGAQIKNELDKVAQWSKKSFTQLASWTTKEVKSVATWTAKEVKDSGRKVKLATQKVKETMGKSTKTVDTEVELQVTALKEMQRDYQSLCSVAKKVAKSAEALARAQAELAEAFAHIAERDLALRPELACQSKLNELVSKNADGLNDATKAFQEKMSEFLKKRVEETLRLYEAFQTKRLEYDAFRADYDTLKESPSASGTKVTAAEQKYLSSYTAFQDARAKLVSSIEELSSEKVSLMKTQLSGLLNAYSLYISGNHAGLDQALAALKTAQAELASKNVDKTYQVKTEAKKAPAAAAASGHSVDGEEDETEE